VGFAQRIFQSASKVPGSPEAATAALKAGSSGDVSWNPYSSGGPSVWDIGAGGTQLSQSDKARDIGRTVGTLAALYFGGAAAAGGSGDGASAAGTGAGAGGGSVFTAQNVATAVGTASSLASAAKGQAGPNVQAPEAPKQASRVPDAFGIYGALAGAGQSGGSPGVAQTFLTGPGGIDPSLLKLGKTTLLGG